MNALKKEIESYKSDNYLVKTVFIGGGTPTLLEDKDLYSLVECIHSSFKLIPHGEFTIEANPGTLSRDKLKCMKEIDINRLSIGLQAYQDRILKILGRIHTAKDFEQNYATARDVGFDNINVDTIFGLPGQTLKDYLETLKKLIELSPEHISSYALSVEEGTPFYRWREKGELLLPTEEEERSMYHTGISLLLANGYKHYEISNFSVHGRESKHNMIYWKGEKYLGLGAGAHSYINNQRFCNYSSIQKYVDSILNGRGAIDHIETISFEDAMAEYCFLGLRLIEGIDKEDFKYRFKKDIKFYYGEGIENLKNQGLLRENSRNLKLTTKGLDFANVVFMEFLP